MTAKRDGSFPATSIGRVQGANISRTTSFETLSAHPLLASASPASAPSPETQHIPKYVPYTPRHRVPSPFATTGTTLDSSTSLSPQQHHGAAASKLQSMNLKAALRDIGLTIDTVGWLMMEKVLNEPAHDTEWNEIWNSVTTGKATLLLPSDNTVPHEKITPEFMRDHIIFWDGSSRNNAPIVTLSGLRAVLAGEELTFRSSLHPLSRPFQDILGTFSRSSALNALPALTFPSGLPAAFPTFSLTSYTPNLSLPPRTMVPNKSQSVSRPNKRMPLNAPSRLSTTFTSLFGKSAASTPIDSSPTQSDTELTVSISVFTIDRHINGQDVGKKMNQSIKSELEKSLDGIPLWVAERVSGFVEDLCPVVKSGMKVTPALRVDTTPYVVNTLQETPSEVSHRFQDFYEELERDLRLDEAASMNNHGEIEENGPRDERLLQGVITDEAKIRETLELVEGVVCSLFYDRIYLLSTSDDASHDETLSSRVAALNMLDLTLENLDVHVGGASRELDLVVKSCGDTLTRLESSVYSPAEKAAVLVATHKVVVESESEGLTQLSSVRLKSDAELYEPAEHLDQASENASTNSTSSQVSDSATILSKPAKPVPVSGDMLLPLIIFSVVKANPSHLVSHLLYIQRFRNKSVGGEESYCLINLLAVAEFLENVDLAALGLADSETKVLSAATLTPISINRSPVTSTPPELVQGGQQHDTLRGRVEQQVDAIAGSANKVISGVVDSFGMLRSLLPSNPDPVNSSGETIQNAGPWNYIPSQFGLLRRETGFSIASIAASLPGAGVRSSSKTNQTEEIGQPLLTVSRPSSVRDDHAPDDEVSIEEKTDEGEKGDDQSSVDAREGGEHDSRSIRSFESMMSGKGRERKDISSRKSISDRLASVSGLARQQNREPEMGLKAPSPFARLGGSALSRPTSPVSIRIDPPNQRLLDLNEDEIKVSDVGELLREYKRVVAALRASGGFDE